MGITKDEFDSLAKQRRDSEFSTKNKGHNDQKDFSKEDSGGARNYQAFETDPSILSDIDNVRLIKDNGDGTVAKIVDELGRGGEEQNIKEANLAKKYSSVYSFIPEVLSLSKLKDRLVMKKYNTSKPDLMKGFQDHWGLSWKEVWGEIKLRSPTTEKTRQLMDLIIREGINVLELSQPSQWGTKENGEPVIIDLGL